jgi:hypothetical protein
MKMTRRNQPQRGFALIIVVLIVALLSIVAVTLLDLVKVDLTITGQNRKNFEARAVADGALYEVFDDLRTQYPANLVNWHWIAANPNNLLNDAGGPVGNPAASGAGCGIAGSPCSNSAYYRPAGVDNPTQDYAADVGWLSTGPVLNTGLNTAIAIYYQVRVVGEVNNGESTAEDRAEVSHPITIQNGTFIPHFHCR